VICTFSLLDAITRDLEAVHRSHSLGEDRARYAEQHIRCATNRGPSSRYPSFGFDLRLLKRCFHGPGGPSVANRSLLRAAMGWSCCSDGIDSDWCIRHERNEEGRSCQAG